MPLATTEIIYLKKIVATYKGIIISVTCKDPYKNLKENTNIPPAPKISKQYIQGAYRRVSENGPKHMNRCSTLLIIRDMYSFFTD